MWDTITEKSNFIALSETWNTLIIIYIFAILMVLPIFLVTEIIDAVLVSVSFVTVNIRVVNWRICQLFVKSWNHVQSGYNLIIINTWQL